ncbi:MAG: phage shock protein PspA [Candidatus Abyssobacteria bacterium SURF_5]|uniref:Phage shock protein PspA n=1 Tax=Abyssobacteria bacterium (strain SURF_5) TaxID=2093360 RepID=A0A3A4NTI6_ABYX5|nr:MAG: phage shock protein PspA [Candidatus Abyssubacteria bacterium SURF_5]
MGIFTRVRDIINSNINSMLDKAEDPEKLIRLMIQEMEDTLVEIRASCADVMAAVKKVQRAREEAIAKAGQWGERAKLAVEKGREDLGREALLEKRRFQERAASLEKEATDCTTLIEQYQADIVQLEEKLTAAREKQRILVKRHTHAQKKKRAQLDIRRMETSDAFIRFEQFENRIERMEAEADLVNFGRKSSLEDEFAGLEGDEEIEQELQDLKDSAEKSREADPRKSSDAPPSQGGDSPSA